MVALPEHKNPVHNAIENKSVTKENRHYLGMSGVGDKCTRKSWYNWRWFSSVVISAQLARIFARGDLEEPRIIKDLESVGVEVTGEQREVIDCTGHCKGHIDGLGLGIPGAEKTQHLLEFKTMKNVKFNKLLKDTKSIGFEKALMSYSSSYWVQIQSYMGYLNIKKCLYIVTNKDNEERIYERINFNPEHFASIKKLIMNILSSFEAPKRISEREDWYECKFCDHKNVCFGHVAPVKSCRTCKFSAPEDDGIWSCTASDNKVLTLNEQKLGCDKYVVL